MEGVARSGCGCCPQAVSKELGCTRKHAAVCLLRLLLLCALVLLLLLLLLLLRCLLFLCLYNARCHEDLALVGLGAHKGIHVGVKGVLLMQEIHTLKALVAHLCCAFEINKNVYA